MAGIYIHIPFCRKACHYCNFHFSTTLHYKENLIEAINKELSDRKEFLGNTKPQTVYFGGGTPSLLSIKELSLILDTLHKVYDLSEVKEFTLEANPDDITPGYLNNLKQTPVNRLSIGIQSFNDAVLTWMNRAHTGVEAETCLRLARESGFHAFNLDLIYGVPNLSELAWQETIEKALTFEPDHISAYCLTIEPKTALAHKVEKGEVKPAEELLAEKHFYQLRSTLLKTGYQHYEISNFAKPNKLALHNTNYWKGLPYLGVGPGAHSFKNGQRRWNLSNNQIYLKGINANALYFEEETLSLQNQFNEQVMTGLRTQWGVNLNELETLAGKSPVELLFLEADVWLKKDCLQMQDHVLTLTEKGLLMADRIASDLFWVDPN